MLAASNLGRVLAERQIHLIYGRGCLGLMGCVSTAAHLGGSNVLGIIHVPLATANITGLTVGTEIRVGNMHERMAKMLGYSDAFIALPGGIGTLEEIFQIASWAHLNIHNKPIGLLNVNGFYDGLLNFLDHAVEQNLLSPSARQIFISTSTLKELIDLMHNFFHKPDEITAQLDWSGRTHKRPRLDVELHL